MDIYSREACNITKKALWIKFTDMWVRLSTNQATKELSP